MRIVHRSIFLLVLGFGFLAYAEAPVAPDSDFWQALLNFLGGMKGMSGLALAAAVVQLAMVFFNTSYGNLAGKWKLVIVYGLSLVGAVVAGLASGLAILPALLNGTVLAAAQVFINEIIKHFKEDKVLLVGK